jgi:hypothetical protein
MTIKNNSEIFGLIEKEYTKSKSEFVFSIKYFRKKVLQDIKYDDNLEHAEEKLKNILIEVENKIQNLDIKIENEEIKNFESFFNEKENNKK